MYTAKLKNTPDQLICLFQFSLDDLIEQTSSKQPIVINYPDMPGVPTIEPLILHHGNDYESFEMALIADCDLEAPVSDLWALTGFDELHKRGYAAYVIGLSTVGKICNGTYDRFSTLLNQTDTEQHITVAITIDSFNYCIFGADEKNFYNSGESQLIFAPECTNLKAAVAEALGTDEANCSIHEPVTYSDFDRENNGIHCVVCDYVAEPATAILTKNVAIAKRLH